MLTPIESLRELMTAAQSLISGRGEISQPDRASLANDLSRSLASLGPRATAVVGPALRAFQGQELSRLPGLLTDVEGALRSKTAAEQLISELTADRVVIAAWRDCVSAFRDGAASSVCWLRIMRLRSLMEERGHDWTALENMLGGLIADDFYAAAQIGAIDPLPDKPPEPPHRAGLAVERRLELCEAILLQEPPSAEVTVWLALAYAHLPKGYATVGPIQLFAAGLWPDGTPDCCPELQIPDDDAPRELDDRQAEVHFSNLPHEDVVFARVRLPHGPTSEARDRGRWIVEQVLAVASPDSPWLLLNGAAAHSDKTGWFGSLLFSDPKEQEEINRWRDPGSERTAEDIVNLGEAFIEALVQEDATAVSAAREVQWERAAELSNDVRQRVALRLRSIEGALPVPRGANLSLGDAMIRHLRERWTFEYWFSESLDIAQSALYAIPDRGGSKRDLHLDLRGDIMPWERGGFLFRSPRMVARAAELAAALPSEAMQGRVISEWHDETASGPALAQCLQEIDEVFDVFVARAIRQRNAIIHGADTVDLVVRSCDDFLRPLVARLTRRAIDAARDGETLLARLERDSAAELHRRAELAAGGNPEEVLSGGQASGPSSD